MKIAIRGTGRFGQFIANQIRRNNKYTIAFFIDSNADLWGKNVDGIPIISSDDLQNKYQNDVNIVLIWFKRIYLFYISPRPFNKIQ